MSWTRAAVVRGAADPSAAALSGAAASRFACRAVVGVAEEADEFVTSAELVVVAAADSVVVGDEDSAPLPYPSTLPTLVPC